VTPADPRDVGTIDRDALGALHGASQSVLHVLAQHVSRTLKQLTGCG